MERFSHLPPDIINVIFKFYGKIKYSKGKYINIISKLDERYNMLKSIPSFSPLSYKVEYPRMFVEHFENKIKFRDGVYEMIIWNVYNPPDRVMYFLYKPNDNVYQRIWYRK
jgi:hypothetical protein